MFLEEDWLNRIDPAMKELFTQGGSGLTPPAPGLPDKSWGDIGKAANALYNMVNQLRFFVEDGPKILTALEEFSHAQSIYNLQPIAWKLRGNPQRGISQHLNLDKVRLWSQEGKKLRLTMVSLESGVLRYVTEAGELLERDLRTPVSSPTTRHPAPCQVIAETIAALEVERQDAQTQLQVAVGSEKSSLLMQIRRLNDQISAQTLALQSCLAANPPQQLEPLHVDLVDGVLASAAVPGLFRPVRLGNETYVDGGVRELFPIQAAIDLGADTIYGIIASAGLMPRASFANATLMEILNRSLPNNAMDEIRFNETNPPGGWGTRQVKIITPAFNVNPDEHLQIDPGLIGIAMAYGYMRAGDVVKGSRQNPQRAQRLADLITRQPIDVLTAEQRFKDALVQNAAPKRLVELLQVVRQGKGALVALGTERSHLGAAMPAGADRWCLDWERHTWPPPASTPWAPFVFPYPNQPPVPPLPPETVPADNPLANVSTFSSQNVPNAMIAGQHYDVALTMRNSSFLWLGNALRDAHSVSTLCRWSRIGAHHDAAGEGTVAVAWRVVISA
jgi:hypothetical protein